MDLQLRQRRVVLTGAAGVLGRAIAQALAAEGAALALLGRDTDALSTLAQQLLAQGAANALPIACELSDAAATEAAIASAEARLVSSACNSSAARTPPQNASSATPMITWLGWQVMT